MKYAILGDIHANLKALTSVLDDAAAHGATHHACTGDIVGYHTDPHECIEIIRGLGCPAVMGNHDEEAARSEAIIGMNSVARSAMEWTREHLPPEDKAWLRGLRLVRQVQNFTIVHATLEDPASWGYVMSRFDAIGSFSCQFTQVCFHGHTHLPRVFVKGTGAIASEDPAEPVHITAGRKYFINTGSVGHPRDRDRLAAYALYDIERGEIVIRRIPWE